MWRKASRALEGQVLRAIEIYLPITPQDEPGILPGSAQEQKVILDLKRRLSDRLHQARSGLVGGTDYRRTEAYIYIWCPDPWQLMADLKSLLNTVPEITRIELHPDPPTAAEPRPPVVLRHPFENTVP